MRKYCFLLVLAQILTLDVIAQIPQSLSYQGVVRDQFGAPLSETNVSLEIAMLEDSSTGTVYYREEFQNVLTDSFGFVTLQIGTGTPLQTPDFGIVQFADIDWTGGGRWLDIKLDPTNGSSFVDLGSIPMNSVPYSFLSETSNQVIPSYKGPTSITIPQTSITATFAGSWLWENNQHLYILFETAPGAAFSWLQAQELARLLGGHLLTITSAAENAFVLDSILTGSVTTNGAIPLGFTDVVNEGSWGWITGEIGVDGQGSYFTNWATGEPNDFNGSEDIGEMGVATGNPTRTWNDGPASSTRYIATIIEVSYLMRP